MLKSLDPKHQGMFFIVPLNILRIHEVEYDDDHSIASYFEELKKIVISSLKKKGYDNGHEKLIQDEIFSPTFEELLIILCLDKVESNLSKKIKPIFNDKLNSGNSLHQLKDEIFSYFESEIRDNETLNKSNIKKEIIENQLEKDINDCNSLVDMCETIIQEDYEDNLSNDTEALVTEPINQIWVKQDEESEDDVISSPEYEEDESMNEKLDELVSNEPTNTVAQTGDFNCFKCNKKFISAERLVFHERISHNLTEFNIEDCVDKFASAQENVLPKIRKKASHPRLPKRASDPSSKEKTTEICPHCGKEVGSTYLEQHILIHTRPENRCNRCHISFKTQERLEKHMERYGPNHKKIRPSKKKIKCDKCNRHFPSVEKYGVHTCKHFVCDICQEDFVFRGNLEKHKKMHEGETIFPCDKCESICLTRRLLQQHNRKRHDESAKKHKCEICPDKAYVNPQDLRNHISVHHTIEKNYKCDICAKAFKLETKLKEHLQITHEGFTRPLVPCISCDMEFKTSTFMKMHIESGKCSMRKTQSESSKAVADLE